MRATKQNISEQVNGNYIFDYNRNNFGELININNIVAKQFLTFLWQLRYVNF